MESRKYQLQKQIIEAIEANDNDLYSLLKSQWAHRFGVESLEELKNLDLNQVNQNLGNEDNQKVDQGADCILEGVQSISKKEDDNQKKEITIENNQVIESVEVGKKESIENQSYEILDKKNNINTSSIPHAAIEYKKTPEVKALIPLPPKPKYSYLKKWLFRN